MTNATRGRPKRSDRDDMAVKLDRTIVEQAKLVAMRRRTTMAQLLSDLLRGPVDKLYRAEVKSLTAGEGRGGTQ
jgi:hypothetical protein